MRVVDEWVNGYNTQFRITESEGEEGFFSLEVRRENEEVYHPQNFGEDWKGDLLERIADLAYAIEQQDEEIERMLK